MYNERVVATSVASLPHDGTDPMMTWDGIGVEVHNPYEQELDERAFANFHANILARSSEGEQSTHTFDTPIPPVYKPSRVVVKGKLSVWDIIKIVLAVVWIGVAIALMVTLFENRRPLGAIMHNTEMGTANVFNSSSSIMLSLQQAIARATQVKTISIVNPLASQD